MSEWSDMYDYEEDNNEYDYGEDEDDEDHRRGWEEEDQVYGIGYDQLGQLGAEQEWDETTLGTRIEGRKGVADVARKLVIVQADPLETFRDQMNAMIQEYELGITARDRDHLRKPIEKMDFIRFRNPHAYVLGYLVYRDYLKSIPRTPPPIDALQAALQRWKVLIETMEDLSNVRVIKYARAWRNGMFQV
jgi:hypothetical protein